MISLDLDEKAVRENSCVLDFEVVIRVRCSVRSQSHPRSLSQSITLALVAVRLYGLHRRTISLALDEQMVRPYFCLLDFDRVVGVRSNVKS